MSAPSQRERIAELEWELDRHPDCYVAKWSDVTDEDRQTYLRHADRVLAALTPSDPPTSKYLTYEELREMDVHAQRRAIEAIYEQRPEASDPPDMYLWDLDDYRAEFRRMLSICPDEGAMRVWVKPEHLRTLIGEPSTEKQPPKECLRGRV